MTKGEFLRSVPDIITHNTWGYGELEIKDSKDVKFACYRHRDKTMSCGSSASTWAELYRTFSEHLLKEGYMTKA